MSCSQGTVLLPHQLQVHSSPLTTLPCQVWISISSPPPELPPAFKVWVRAGNHQPYTQSSFSPPGLRCKTCLCPVPWCTSRSPQCHLDHQGPCHRTVLPSLVLMVMMGQGQGKGRVPGKGRSYSPSGLPVSVTGRPWQQSPRNVKSTLLTIF